MRSGRQKKTKQKQLPLLFPLSMLMLIPLKLLYFLIIIDQSKDTLKRKLHKKYTTQYTTQYFRGESVSTDAVTFW